MGILFSIFIIFISVLLHTSQIGIGVVILLSCIFYVTFNKKYTNIRQISIKNIGKYSHIIFFILYLSDISIIFNQFYYRNMLFFIIFSVLSCLIVIDIFSLKLFSGSLIIIIKTFLISILIRFSIYYNYPSIIGADAYWHLKLANTISVLGYVPPSDISNKYETFPILHILLSISQNILNIDLKNNAFIIICLSSVILSIFFYIIVNKFLDNKLALFSLLMLNISYYFILPNITNITPGSIVLLFLLILLYFIYNKSDSFKNSFIKMFIFTIIVITHQLTAFVVLIIVFFIYIFQLLYNNFYKKEKEFLDKKFPLFCILFLAIYWIFSYISYKPFFELILVPLIKKLISGIKSNSNEIYDLVNYNIYQQLYLNIIYLIMPFFAIGGSLSWLNKTNIKKFTLSSIFFVLYLFIYGLPLTGINNLFTGRWVIILNIFLTLFASLNIIQFLNICKNNNSKYLLLLLLTFLITFIMITTPGINKDNSFITQENVRNDQFKYSEIIPPRYISRYYTGSIILDDPYMRAFMFYGYDYPTYYKLKYYPTDAPPYYYLYPNNIYGIYSYVKVIRNDFLLSNDYKNDTYFKLRTREIVFKEIDKNNLIYNNNEVYYMVFIK